MINDGDLKFIAIIFGFIFLICCLPVSCSMYAATQAKEAAAKGASECAVRSIAAIGAGESIPLCVNK